MNHAPTAVQAGQEMKPSPVVHLCQLPGSAGQVPGEVQVDLEISMQAFNRYALGRKQDWAGGRGTMTQP